MSSNDDDTRLSEADARFVQTLAEAYRPPEPTAAGRARFAAGLEGRLARGGRRPWWLGAAAAAAAAVALALALLPGEPRGPEDTVAASDAPSAAETLLLLANGPLADPDEALPEDYRTLASLLE